MMATDIAPGDLTPEQLDTLARAAHEEARAYWRTYWLANGRRGMNDFDIGPIEDLTERSRAALDAAVLAVVRGVRALDAGDDWRDVLAFFLRSVAGPGAVMSAEPREPTAAPWFNSTAYCVKCASQDATALYCENGKYHHYQPRHDTPMIHRHCRTCHYEWLERPLDAAEGAPDAT